MTTMRKLNNTKEDKEYLHKLISSGTFPKAKLELGVFTSELAGSLSTALYYGKITSIDLVDGYCHWEQKGAKMPCVNINCITIITE